MSRVQDTIRQLIVDWGQSILDNPDTLLGMLEDYRAFRDEEPVARETLRGLVKAGEVGKILSSPAIKPQTTTSSQQIGKVSPVLRQRSKSKGNGPFRKWLRDNSEDICAVVFFVCLVLAVISLFATFCCLIYNSPKTALWAWILLGSIVAGVITLLVMVIFDV